MKLLERKLLSFTSKIEREISIFSFFFHQLCRLLLLILQLNRRIIFTIFSSYLYSVCCSFFPCTNIQKRKKKLQNRKKWFVFLSFDKKVFFLSSYYSFIQSFRLRFIYFLYSTYLSCTPLPASWALTLLYGSDSDSIGGLE